MESHGVEIEAVTWHGLLYGLLEGTSDGVTVGLLVHEPRDTNLPAQEE